MRRLLILLIPLTLASSVALAAGGRPAPTAEQIRLEVRRAVEAHRTQQRDDIRRQEAEAGRRLTAAERAELREQVRYQWLLPGAAPEAPKAPPAGGARSVDSTGSFWLPRSLRP